MISTRRRRTGAPAAILLIAAVFPLVAFVRDSQPTLEALTREDPVGYLLAGEDLLELGQTRHGIARELLVRAIAYAVEADDPSSAASAAVALGSITDDPPTRAWLEALAQSLNPALTRPAWLEPGGDGAERSALGAEAARVLLDIRTGRGRLVIDRVRDGPLLESLARQPDLVALAGGKSLRNYLADLAREWPCSICHNDRTVRDQRDREAPPSLCPRCRGTPGPDLDSPDLIVWLTVEARLLGADADRWSYALTTEDALPARDPDPAQLARRFSVDLERSRWAAGGWTEPDSP